MASSDMASVEPWSFRPAFIDPWFPEALTRGTQTFTEALTKFLSDSTSDLFSAAEGLTSDPFSTLLTSLTELEPATTHPFSKVSGGSHPEPAPSKRQMSAIPVSATSGKVSKRKLRPSKRSRTTFITADPANFRQMVQQVTGVRFGGCSQLQAAASILKPEAQRPGGRFSAGIIPSGCLPTLDTSADLPSSAGGAMPPYVEVADGGCTGGLDIDSFASFPTLESWNDV